MDSDCLQTLLQQNGAALVGFGDLSEVPEEQRSGLPVGVSVAVAYKPFVIGGIGGGPTREYYAWYNMLNERLDRIVTAGAEYLERAGYRAVAQTRERVGPWEGALATPLPHKTIATRAGIGWIGKCALLINERYGSMIRLSSILTDAPLTLGQPVNASRCGGCRACADECPGHAVTGVNWSLGMARDEIFNAALCRQKARELCDTMLGEQATICGKCIYVCPYTKKYVNGGGRCA